jgi:hypothetical protein
MRLTGEGAARLYRDNVWKNFGLFRKLICDRGKEFVNAFTHELLRILGIEHNPSTAFHAQTNGQAERTNAEIERYLRQWISYRQTDWAEWIAMAEFAINNRTSSSTTYSPFFLNLGRHPRMGFDFRRSSSQLSSPTQFAKNMQRAWEDSKAALQFAANTMKEHYDKSKYPPKQYSPGDEVLLDSKNIKTHREAKKFDDKWYGPFKVIKKIGTSAYRLEVPKSWKKIYPSFHESLLIPYVPPYSDLQKRQSRPPPELVDGERQWEVESILNHGEMGKRGAKQWKFKVKWKGYPTSEATWEFEESLSTHAQEILKEYKAKYPEHFNKQPK